MIKLAVNGASGRMGRRILELARAAGDFDVCGSFDADDDSKICAEALKTHGKGVLIDFSTPTGTSEALACAHSAGWGLVIGTTGLNEEAMSVIDAVSRDVPVVVSSNMSVGVNLLLDILDLLSKKLPRDFKVEMSEAHHVHKKDAPSGTALMLARQIAFSRPTDLAALSKSIKVTREGEIVGDHSVTFDSPAETIEIRHHAKSRDIFAQGALVAAHFAAKAKPGKYAMADVLKK